MPEPTISYRGYIIEPKRDFGPYGYRGDGGHVIRVGFLAVKDGCNATPGAGWYTSIAQARRGIDALIAAQGDAQRFYAIFRAGGSNA